MASIIHILEKIMRYNIEKINLTRVIGDWEFNFISNRVAPFRFICVDKVSLNPLVVAIDGKDCNIIFRTSTDAEKYITTLFPDRKYDIVFVRERKFKDRCVMATYKRRK
jgi:hypothetical protein